MSEQCDEQGPPCANCMARDNTDSCTYTANLPTPPQENAGASSWGSRSDISQKATPILETLAPETRRRLELELLHRWSTSTYRSFSEVPEDFHYMQVEVPRGAFKYDFVLYGVLSVTALEAAMCEEPESTEYILAALEYYDEASRLFRAELANPTPDNLHLLYTFSFLAAAINMALPQCLRADDGAHGETVLQRMTVLFELLIGCGSLVTSNWAWMMDSPLSVSIQSAMLLRGDSSIDSLDSTAKDALARLEFVVESSALLVSESTNRIEDLNTVPNLTFAGQLSSSQKAVRKLWECFTEDAKGVMKAFCISFPITAGRDFTVAFSNSNPVALFILMHWGVLVHRLNDSLWWARSVGRDLVLEISENLLLSQTPLAMMREWQDGITWARRQVGLPALE